jgi:hypothetical protein
VWNDIEAKAQRMSAPPMTHAAAALKLIVPSARVTTGLHVVRAGVTHWRAPESKGVRRPGPA